LAKAGCGLFYVSRFKKWFLKSMQNQSAWIFPEMTPLQRKNSEINLAAQRIREGIDTPLGSTVKKRHIL
jgi:hypothetical protein